MCFANAVLQVLIYCPPFYRLFHDLAKFLDGDVSNTKTPLVSATVRFLNEFMPKTRPAPEGKGKAVDRTHSYSDDDDLMDSFIPTYVYDALKEKKRFDHMRVSQLHLPVSLDSISPRAATKKTQRNFWAFTWTRWKRSSSPFLPRSLPRQTRLPRRTTAMRSKRTVRGSKSANATAWLSRAR